MKVWYEVEKVTYLDGQSVWSPTKVLFRKKWDDAVDAMIWKNLLGCRSRVIKVKVTETREVVE